MGADGYAEITIDQNIKQNQFSFGNFVGKADFSYVARANLRLFDLKSDDPVWQIQNIDGDPSAKGDDQGKELSTIARQAKLGKEASSSALAKLAATFPGK